MSTASTEGPWSTTKLLSEVAETVNANSATPKTQTQDHAVNGIWKGWKRGRTRSSPAPMRKIGHHVAMTASRSRGTKPISTSSHNAPAATRARAMRLPAVMRRCGTGGVLARRRLTSDEQVGAAGDQRDRQQPAQNAAEVAEEQELEEGAEGSEQSEADVGGLETIAFTLVVVGERAIEEVAGAGADDDEGPAVRPGLPVVGGRQGEEDEPDGGDDGAWDGELSRLALAEEGATEE